MAFGILYDFLMGQSINAHEYFGAHFIDAKDDAPYGVMFRLYAPLADDVSVIGEWNNWNTQANKMNKVDMSGVWETFIPYLKNYQCYKFHFKNAQGQYVDKIDPFAFYSEMRPGTCSRLFDNRFFAWHDDEWQKSKNRNFDRPMSIYELHLGSWKGLIDGRNPSYEEVATWLIPHVKGMGFTHVEIMPITQYPFDGSWGYQGTGFFSVDSRYGNPFQLMSFIDRMHEAGIGVILDFAPIHFASDNWALAQYDGSNLFEYDGDMRVSQWGSLQFNLGKDPVRSFLMSAVNYFVDYFHFDGVRLDAVSCLIYRDGNKNNGVNEGAVEFVKRLNGKMHIAHDGVMMIAEDSSDYFGVTFDTDKGGLGFDYKWDLGWMNDTLKYYSLDPVYKKYDHNKLTFSMAYFYSNNFMLPFSHDEVVHGKGTLINKLYGDYKQKFMLLRNLFCYQFAHPGKKLNFMGNELASFDEWNEAKSLPWVLKTYPAHDSMTHLVRDLNLVYQNEKCLHFEEHNPFKFRWLMVDNADQSVFVFERFYEDEVMVFVFNMTSNYYESYDIPIDIPGTYEEVINSEKAIYGGCDQYNGLPLKTEPYGPENKPYHITIKLASFASCYFKKVKEVDTITKGKENKPKTKKVNKTKRN